MADRTDHPSILTATTASTLPQQGAASEARATVSHGRYLLGDVLGSGGFGQVHRATDTLTGEAVAIKFVPALSPIELARARRELAALRWLRLPGVVRLRDDGLDGSSWFMVMDLVEGRPFDEIDTSGGWERWAPCVLELLEVLARVHLAGVLHLDLKPSNVLVTPEGRVILLDLGIARGRALPEVAEGRIEGTPRYMAPEQRRGEPCDARTDLYAVGAMLARMAHGLPESVQAMVASLCAERPEDRPPSALAAYQALAGRRPFPSALSRSSPWSYEELRALFAGVGRFTHLPEDAAALVWERTGGQPEQVQTVLESWILSGHASWRDEALVVDRLALERLREPLPLDLRGTEVPALVAEACSRARTLRHQGRLNAAVALLEAVFPLARELPTQERLMAEGALLDERVLAAVAMERADAADLGLYAIDRAHPTPHGQRLSGLLRLVRAVCRREGGSARAHAAEVPIFSHPELEIWRMGYSTRAAELLGGETEDSVFRELEAWSRGDPLREAKHLGWLGIRLYRRGEYRQAALAHERAAAGKGAAIDRLASIINAASAWLEALDLPRAEAQAREAAALAHQLRLTRYEALAVCMTQTAAYRAGHPDPPDPLWIDAAAEVGPDLEALFAATAAATAFRLADRASTLTFAQRAAQKFAAVGMTPGAQLMRALAAWAKGPSAQPELATLAEEARGCPIPDLELQILALARWRALSPPLSPPPDWIERAQKCAAARPREQWTTRLDILSVEEALADAPPEGALG